MADAGEFGHCPRTLGGQRLISQVGVRQYLGLAEVDEISKGSGCGIDYLTYAN